MSIISETVRQLRDITAATRKNRDYYTGHHAPAFMTNTYTNPHRELIYGLRDNQCRNVIDLVVDRLTITGFAPNAISDTAMTAAAARGWDLWQANRMEGRVRDWFTSCEVAGRDGVIIVWPDSTGKVRFWLQEPGQCGFERSEEDPDRLLWVSKRWWDGTHSNITVYTPDMVEVWTSTSTLRDPDAETYRLDPAQTMVNPLGQTPAYAVRLTVSDLDSVIPLQNALNTTLANAAITGAYYSQPMRVWLGMELEIDPETGKKVPPFELGASRSVFLPPAGEGEQNTDVKDLPGHSPIPFIAEADSYRAAIARVTRTPAHLLLQAGDIPSGEALRVAEAPFIAKVEARQHLYGAVIADAVALAVRLDLGMYDAAMELVTVWKPAASESLESNAKVATDLSSIGVPLAVVLVKVMGWDAETAQAVAEQAAAAAADKAAQTARMFDAGTTGA